jgi:hypothetical protein
MTNRGKLMEEDEWLACVCALSSHYHPLPHITHNGVELDEAALYAVSPTERWEVMRVLCASIRAQRIRRKRKLGDVSSGGGGEFDATANTETGGSPSKLRSSDFTQPSQPTTTPTSILSASLGTMPVTSESTPITRPFVVKWLSYVKRASQAGHPVDIDVRLHTSVQTRISYSLIPRFNWTERLLSASGRFVIFSVWIIFVNGFSVEPSVSW